MSTQIEAVFPVADPILGVSLQPGTKDIVRVVIRAFAFSFCDDYAVVSDNEVAGGPFCSEILQDLDFHRGFIGPEGLCRRFLCVAVGDIDRGDIFDVIVPDQWEGRSGLLPAGCVNGVLRIVLDGV